MKMLRTEWEKLAPMNFTERRQYIWEYYKLHIFALLVLVFMAGSLMNTLIFNPPRQDFLYFVWIGPQVSPFELDDFAEDLNIIVENPNRYVVRAANYCIQGLDPQTAMALRTRLVAQVQMRRLDVFMLTKEELYDLSSSGLILPIMLFMDALEELNPITHEIMAQRLVEITFFYMEDEYATTGYMAASLVDVPFFDKFDIGTDNLYLAIVINSERFERAARALEVIFDV